jgi:putative colanic acid biosysnthesis UDP-glucose lipid carrier transferase
VGPRPHALVHDDAFWSVNRAYPRRFLARPGITGLAQVSGHRGATDTADKVHARVACDLDYIDDWTLERDLRIILGTVRLIAHDANAY